MLGPRYPSHCREAANETVGLMGILLEEVFAVPNSLVHVKVRVTIQMQPEQQRSWLECNLKHFHYFFYALVDNRTFDTEAATTMTTIEMACIVA